ncbi:MAG TPA: hypothetical protein VG013_01625 [Gemmataceae bacterium]|jgi:hypothetical protein|nr:hypothetical protein [Gemmataceae bacterium]
MNLPPAGGAVRVLWTHASPHRLQGLVLAREKGWLLTWDDKHWLYVLNGRGERQGQVNLPGLAAACCAEDGSAYAAAGRRGEVWWLAPDLTTRWQRTVPQAAVAAALDPFGQYLAVADARGALHVFDAQARSVCLLQTARPLHHLAFVPAAPRLLGSSDFGLVACFDLAGRAVWRDGLVAHIGSLAVTGDGAEAVLACFSEGLQRYTLEGQNLGRLSTPEPCRLAGIAFDGRLILAAGLSSRIQLLDPKGQVLLTHSVDKPVAALALSALADRVLLALADGQLICLELLANPGG